MHEACLLNVIMRSCHANIIKIKIMCFIALSSDIMTWIETLDLRSKHYVICGNSKDFFLIFYEDLL